MPNRVSVGRVSVQNAARWLAAVAVSWRLPAQTSAPRQSARRLQPVAAMHGARVGVREARAAGVLKHFARLSW
jgi:hypothetical protein